jgi:hypothetical protein
MIVKPPIGHPEATKDEYWLLKRTLYGLCNSPLHCIHENKSILNQPCLHQNAYDPCLSTNYIIDLSNPANTPSSFPLTLGLYVNDFVYFSEDSEVEAKFQKLLKALISVDFMGAVEWFLGIHFQWLITPKEVQVHLSQTGFAAHLVGEKNFHMRNITPEATPYHLGLPIDAIPGTDEDEQCPTFQERRQNYQSVVGLIGWLAQNTHPDLAISNSFLSAYCNRPSCSH